jgi:hypothetical protein
MSLVRRFVTLFGSQFPISRSVFANTFSDLFFGSIEQGNWSFPEYAPEAGRGVKADFPRSIESAGQTIRFCPKKVTGVNGGLRIEWDNGSQLRSFFTKLWSHTRPRPLRACEGRFQFAHDSQPFGQRPTQTLPSSEFDGDIFMDFREMTIYMLLEAFGAGPLVSFVLDAYSAGSFHIVTAEVRNAVFPPRRSPHTGISGATDEQRQQYAQQYSANRVAFLEKCLLVGILGLDDCHRDNFCSGSTDSTRPGTSTLQIIDFVPPRARMYNSAPDRDEVMEWIRRSDLVPQSAFPLNEEDLQQAFNNLNVKFSQLRRRKIPIAVYPPIEGQRPLADLLDDTKRGELICPGDPVTCSEFVVDIETQIRELFFKLELSEFGGRTLGALFGFTDLDKIWNRTQFDSAVDGALKAHFHFKFSALEDFLTDVIDRLEKDYSLPEQKVRILSVNYALAQIRWLSIWLEWRVSSIMKCFSPQVPRST